MTVEIRTFKPTDRKAWNEYVATRDQATVYHSLAWRDVVRKQYGFRDYYVLAKADGQLKGIFPIFLVSNFSGRRMISLPVSMWGGPVAEDKKTLRMLIAYATRFAKKNSASLDFVSHTKLQLTGLSCSQPEMRAIVELQYASMSDFLDKHFARSKERHKVKKAARKAKKEGVTLHMGKHGLVEQYHNLYLTHRKRLGLPVPSRLYLERILDTIQSRVVVCYQHGSPVAGALILEDGDSFYLAEGVANEKGKRCHAVDLYMWRILEESLRRHKKRLDLGGSFVENEGLRRFKRKWGAKEFPIYRYATLVGSPNDKDRKLRGVPFWDKLPDGLIKVLSPLVIRWFY